MPSMFLKSLVVGLAVGVAGAGSALAAEPVSGDASVTDGSAVALSLASFAAPAAFGPMQAAPRPPARPPARPPSRR